VPVNCYSSNSGPSGPALKKRGGKGREGKRRFKGSTDEYNCITQRDTQPSQTCSEGSIFLLLYATVVFLWIRGT